MSARRSTEVGNSQRLLGRPRHYVASPPRDSVIPPRLSQLRNAAVAVFGFQPIRFADVIPRPLLNDRARRVGETGVLPWFCLWSLAALLSMAAASWLLAGDVGLLDSRLLVATRRLAVTGSPIGLAARALMLSATALGAFATLALVILAAGGFLVSVDRRAAAFGLIAKAGLGMLLADRLKHLVGRPRPEIVAHWADVTSSSFPSGHSADSAITYFLLAALAHDHLGASRAGTYVQRISVALVLLVGMSRVYLGVHYPTDVFAGWAFGAAWVLFCRWFSVRDAGARALRARTFHDVIVHPTQQLLEPPFLLFRGGPDWPLFWLRRDQRHCRFAFGIPLDVRPRRAAELVIDRESQGIWGGAVTNHFGHAVTTFGSRIAGSSLLPPYVPLVFSARQGEQPPPFFWRMLAHFGVPPERVRIVSRPVIFDTLSVLPQAERLFGGAPSPTYLDLLDELSGPAPGRRRQQDLRLTRRHVEGQDCRRGLPRNGPRALRLPGVSS